MGKSLVIVESPAKAKTINKYLGNQYVVKSSIGHIRDLPTSGSASASKEPAAKRGKAAAGEGPVLSPKEKARKQLVSRMGVDPDHGWKAQYEILPGKEKVIEELRRLAKDADTIYLATDLDREGEAIAWHLREAIGGDDSRYKRVVFNEITKKAIQEAFSEPGELDIDRVNAQQARRFLDRVVGYMVSPLLWAKIARGLSAGRVQSVAVKLVVEREREIRAFNPEEYWEVHADLGTTKGSTVRFEVAREKGEAFKPLNEAQAMAALEKLKSSSYSIVKREDKPTSSKPSAPFITSTLQQAASNRLGFGVKKTMMMAQRLYEAGYITYMRTDSTNLSADAVTMARTYIEDEFGKKYLPETPNVYSSKEGAQEAHEAIRPSDANTTPSKLAGMERDAERLYELIWRQFLACQMLPAQYLSTTVSVGAGDFELRAKGRILKFDGYTRVMPQIAKPGDDDVLPDMAQGDVMKLIKLDPSQHFTKPPARYSEASLVKEMEKRGIGRPSTYAAIISTIQDRGYVTLHNRRFYSEKMGDIVTERLSESFSNLMDYGFTAGMEENLDDVAQGERDWKNVLDEFYGDFKKKLEVAENPDSGMRANQPVMTDIPCTTCGRPMQIRTASTGVFLGCSGYSLPPKERCKATVNLVPGDEIAADDEGESESLVLRGKHRCPICSTAMDAYLLDEKRKLHICGNNPDCAGYEIEEGSYRIKGYEGPSLECDKCGSEMQLKTGRFGKFFGCTNPTCKNTRKLLKSGDAAPPKMDPVKMPELKCEKVNDTYILRDGASGLFLAASQFPKNRETRAPLVIEILPHKDEIDPKYHFLCDAPQKDPDGLPAVIRYSRKTKEQYVQTEVDGKPTGWKAYFDGGKWTVEDKRTKAKAE
ncbi:MULTISPECIES: type I DNA topoisomerase [Pseudomonas]|uniref:DNA topoisomerase 1 n=2 Tax=Pseudomonas TaxID=286 RepID=A0A9E6T9Z9_9PSED|nr:MULTISPECIES: type I DNA topoisomerase [Pseudomonas]MBF6037130.1 type I DNA topoisomerase [Pseudomonas neuropathica]PIF48491.1 DNA topoisomerase I [Pseudomonas sp. 29]QXI10209.1 type I DNA topoisomerase [Pseudomonas zeae]SEO27266.1 DNA topoisomerase I [Pseudomonas sp. ok266]